MKLAGLATGRGGADHLTLITESWNSVTPNVLPSMVPTVASENRPAPALAPNRGEAGRVARQNYEA
jgi:hypothetical protein